ncbi:dTDP-4-dehydrorhamnose reductase [Streptomyces sp. M19]
MSRWLVTGAGGMLGREVLAVLSRDPAARVTGATRAALDITDAAAVRAAVAEHDIVINAAAWTDVNGAEAHEEAAAEINGRGVRTLASACATVAAPLVHVSTDYVFPGRSAVPYAENAATGPVNAYGRGKLVGERAVAELLPRTGYVVRTAWLYGTHGRNFVRTVLDRAAAGEPLRVVDDQYGQPTWAGALAERLAELGRRALDGRAPGGIYHGTATGRTTWCALARGAGAGRVRPGVRPARHQPGLPEPGAPPRVQRAGPRPVGARGLPPMAHWTDMLAQALPPGARTPWLRGVDDVRAVPVNGTDLGPRLPGVRA